MSALNHFLKFCGTFAERIAWARPSPGLDREYRDRNEQCALPPDDKRVARTLQNARDDEKRAQPPHGSHPAVWPR